MAAAVMLAIAAHGAHAAPTLDDQVYAIANDLMCPVCSGQTVADSNSELAGQMRQIIRDRLLAGQSRDEIIAYFVAQFGEGVLASPRPHGGGLVLWLSLPAALVAGLLVIRHFVRRSPAAAQPAQAPAPPTPAEAEEIERELRRLE
jgi:cytochrome c-type biogenesis protein CcmH